MDEQHWRSILNNWFAGRSSDAIDRAWQHLKTRYSVDDEVTGVVVAKAQFGAWIEIEGFPALLEIICMAELTPERYQADDWCPIGSQVSGFIAGFKDNDRQIVIYQVRPGRFTDQTGDLEDR